MKEFQFLLPTRIVFGNGVVKNVGEEAKKLGTHAFIVTDKGVLGAGHIEPIEKNLNDAGLEVEIFDEVDPNPRDTSVQKGAEVAKNSGCDVLVGVGGGSSIDTAKAIGIILAEGGTIQDYEGFDTFQRPIMPLVAIPTTAGTGSEVTFWSIITDTKRKLKMGIGSRLIAPRIALVDPELTLSLPSSLTTFTGVDALVHAIEGYTATRSQPISDALALSAIELIGQNIRQAYANGSNAEARYNMMAGSLLAGIAFGNSDCGAVHCMGEALGGLYDTPHGLSMAIFLPYVIEHNLIANPDKFARVARALGEDVEGLSLIEAARKSVDAAWKLIGDLNIPTPREVGLKEEDLEGLAEAAFMNEQTESNPRVMGKEDFLSLFKKAYGQ